MSNNRVGISQTIVSFLKCDTRTIKDGLKILFIGGMLALLFSYLQNQVTFTLWNIPHNMLQAISGFTVLGFFRKLSRKLLIGEIDLLFIISAYTGVGVLLPANLKKIFVTRG